MNRELHSGVKGWVLCGYNQPKTTKTMIREMEYFFSKIINPLAIYNGVKINADNYCALGDNLF